MHITTDAQMISFVKNLMLLLPQERNVKPILIIKWAMAVVTNSLLTGNYSTLTSRSFTVNSMIEPEIDLEKRVRLDIAKRNPHTALFFLCLYVLLMVEGKIKIQSSHLYCCFSISCFLHKIQLICTARTTEKKSVCDKMDNNKTCSENFMILLYQ